MQRFNQKLTDKGWASMQSMLDRDMPVNSRRNRRAIAWWFLGGAGLLVLTGVGAWHLALRTATPSATQPSVDQPIAHQSTTVRQTQAEPYAAAFAPLVQREPVPGGGTMTSFAIVRRHSGQANGQEQVSSQAAATGITPDYNAQFTSLKSAQVEGTPVVYHPDIPSAVPMPVLIGPLPIDVNDPDFAAFNPVQPNSLTKPVAALTRNRRWRYGVYGGISAEKLVAVNGLAAGFTTTWQPLRHWGLRVGLGYSIERPTLRNRPVADISGQRYVDYVNSGNLNTSTLSTDPNAKLLIPVRYIHQIEMPVLVFWQPSAKWRFYGGAKFARTIFANSDKFSYVSGSASEPSSVLVENRSLNVLATHELSFWKVYGNFGVAFMPNKHWEVGLFTQLHWEKHHRVYNDGSFADQLKSQSLDNPYNLRFQCSTTLFF
jgi:hypothetical protein